MNPIRTKVQVALAAAAIGLIFAERVVADPLPHEVLKFQQLPLNNTLTPYFPAPLPGGAPYYGHDELSTATRTASDPQAPWQGTYMADDFADKFTTPVVHVRWWGSYMNDHQGEGVKQFLISFESDVPVGPNNPLPYSHPGVPLLNQIVTLGPLAPGSGTFTEKLIPTPVMPTMGPLEALYEYNAELNLDKYFPQHPDTVYWLKIVALVDVQRDGFIEWGWHNRDWSIFDPLASTPPAVMPGEGPIGTVTDPIKGFSSPVYHFQDDAVQGPITVFPDPSMPNMPNLEQGLGTPQNYIYPWDGPDSIQQFSKDLAFELYTIPEPAAGMLLAAGLGMAFLLRWKR
ncbi:MAG: PEP-CTERM sorting domain-containing protein [Pirellulales bacterium]|nr:PEP-CTERM sorting domain-containing protein [Pirellulales bacterium]